MAWYNTAWEKTKNAFSWAKEKVEEGIDWVKENKTSLRAGALAAAVVIGVGVAMGATVAAVPWILGAAAVGVGVAIAHKSATSEEGWLNKAWQWTKGKVSNMLNSLEESSEKKQEKKKGQDIEMNSVVKNTVDPTMQKKAEELATQSTKHELEGTSLLSEPIKQAFDEFKTKNYENNDVVKRTDSSMVFPNKESAVDLLKQQAGQGQAFELGDASKDFYVFSDGKGNFYEGNKEGLEAFKQEVKEQQEHREKHASKFDKVLSQMQTEGFTNALSSTNELHDNQEQKKELDPLGGGYEVTDVTDQVMKNQ